MPFKASAPAAPWRSLTAAERLVWLVGGGTLAAITLMPLSATRIYTWPWSLIVAGLWLLPCALLIVQLSRTPAWRPPSPLITTALGLLTVSVVVSAWTSPYSEVSLVRTWPTLGGVSFYFLLHHWLAGQVAGRAWTAAKFLGLMGAILAPLSLAGWVYVYWPDLVTFRNDAPFGHANYTGGIMVLLLPWIGLQAFQSRAKARIGWIGAFCVGLLAIQSSGSRGALAGMAVSVVTVFFVVLRSLSWSLRRRVALASTLLAVTGGIALLNPRVRDFVQNRGYNSGSLAARSDRYRAWMIEAGLRLGAQRPVLGWGPGTAPLAFPRVRASIDGGVDNMLQLHSTPIQIWATLGGTGVVVLGLLTLGTTQAVGRALKRKDLPLTTAAVASLAGYGVFSLTDHQFELPIVTASTTLALALLTSRSSAITHCLPLGRLSRSLIGLHLAVLLGGPAYALTRDMRARHMYEKGVVAWEDKRPDEFLAALDRATALTPYDPFFLHHAANQFLSARDLMPDEPSKKELTTAAIAKLEASLATHVYEDFAHFNLGWLYLDRDPALAARHFLSLARLVPDKPGVYFGLGLALRAMGNPDGAIRAFAVEWISDPFSITAPVWESPEFAALKPAVRAEMARLYAQLEPQFPHAAGAESWTRWWLGESVSAEELRQGLTSDQIAFADALPLIETRGYIPGNLVWQKLYRAWLHPEATDAWQKLLPQALPLAAAIQRRAQEEQTSFAAFLRAPVGGSAGLTQTYRAVLAGYGVRTFHPDGPPIFDAYITQENRLLSQCARELFPPKGWLPPRLLLPLLPSANGTLRPSGN